MARKDTLNYIVKQFTNNTLVTDVDNFADPTEVNFMDNIGIILAWSGAPVGQFEIYVSNSAKIKEQLSANDFVKLDFGATIEIDATETNHLVSINQIPFKWIAVKYVFSSGSGALTVFMNNKMVGG
jgi:hypothetical protein